MIRNAKRSGGLKTIAALFIALPLVLPITIVTAADTKPAQAQNAATPVVEFKSLSADVVETVPKRVTIAVAPSQYDQQVRVVKPIRVMRPVIIRPAVAVTPDPGLEEKRLWVQKAASAYSIDWRVLEAVWQVESGKAWYSGVSSYSGAIGPCQFLTGTWNKYAQDGNGDGVSDIHDARDCLFGAAKLLAANGAASGDNIQALLAYNHSLWYVQKVLAIANSI